MERNENEELVRHFLQELVGHRNLKALETWCAEDFFDHNPLAGAEEGGAAATREGLERLYQGLPDARIHVGDVIAAGDRVFVRSSVFGTHLGDLMGLRPTGKLLKMEVWHLFRVEAGKIVEHRAQSDTLMLLRQIAGGQRTADVVLMPAADEPTTLA